jgi:HSP20 family protein
MATVEKKKETRGLTPWRPFGEMTRWEQEIQRMFGDLFRRSLRPFRDEHLWTPLSFEVSIPAVDLYEEKDEIVAKAELPGIEKDDVQINIANHELTIKGEKRREEKANENDYYRAERCYGSFVRVLSLPREVEGDKVRASFKNGVLEIRLPKTEEAKKREVRVKVKVE